MGGFEAKVSKLLLPCCATLFLLSFVLLLLGLCSSFTSTLALYSLSFSHYAVESVVVGMEDKWKVGF